MVGGKLKRDEYGLLPAHRKFADEWIRCGCKVDAYRFAYPKANDNSVKSGAYKVYNRSDVQKYLDIKRAEHTKKADLKAERIIFEEMQLAFHNVADAFRNGTVLPPEELPESLQRALTSFRVKEDPLGNLTYEYKFNDKGRALERLSRIIGLYEQDNSQKQIIFKTPVVQKPANSGISE